MRTEATRLDADNSMKTILSLSLLLLSLSLTPASQPATGDDKLARMLQQSTLTLLREGNLRFADGKSFHPNLEASRRSTLAAAGQEPIATILACSDSRDPVELIFDRGIGDLFIVRVAGNVAGLSELATIEYGVTHLGTPVLVVMGHTKCGAVTAAVQGGELHGHLPALISLIKPAAEKAKIAALEETQIPRAIELNVWQQIENIFHRSALVRDNARAGKVQIVGALYDLASGRVQWLGAHPEWARLVNEAHELAALEAKAHPLPAALLELADAHAAAPASAHHPVGPTAPESTPKPAPPTAATTKHH